MAVSSRWKSPANPSAHTPAEPRVAREWAVGQTFLSALHFTVGSPLELDHLFENEVNGIRTVLAPLVTVKSAL